MPKSVLGGRGASEDDHGQSLLPVVLDIDPTCSLRVKLQARRSPGWPRILLMGTYPIEVKAKTQMFVESCSWQQHGQYPGGGSDPNVHRQLGKQVDGLAIQWNITQLCKGRTF